MSDKPKISKADMDKILNCQDQLQSSLEGLVKATKKFNEQSLKLEKQSAGLPTSTRGSPYYNMVYKKKALNAANNTIDKIVKDYTVDLAAIDKNIGILKSQQTYQKRMNDLIAYYKQNISTDQKQIADEKSKRAIANRMSTFYNDKTQTSKKVKTYTSYIYWGIFAFALIFLLRAIILMGGFNFGMITGALTSVKLATEKLINNADKKVKNKLSKSQQAKIMEGPSNLNRSSKAFASPGMRRDAFNKANLANRKREQRFQFGGKKPTSLQPWLTIVLLFLLMPFVIIPFIIKPLQPYFIELTLPRVSN